MRLIDADALIRIVQQSAQDAGLHFSDSQKFLRWLRNARTINAVPVVRCKDCIHAAPLEGYASRKFEIGLNCRACRGDSGYGITGLSFTVPDGYCDDGLRRAGEAK